MRMLEVIVTMLFLRKENNTKKSLRKFKRQRLKPKILKQLSNPRLMLQSLRKMLKNARMSSALFTIKVRSIGI